MLVHQRGDRQPQQYAYRNVNGQMKIEARLVEHGPVVECNNQRVLGKPRDAVVGPSGDETAGEQNAEPGMADARQRLGASEAFAL